MKALKKTVSFQGTLNTLIGPKKVTSTLWLLLEMAVKLLLIRLAMTRNDKQSNQLIWSNFLSDFILFQFKWLKKITFRNIKEVLCCNVACSLVPLVCQSSEGRTHVCLMQWLLYYTSCCFLLISWPILWHLGRCDLHLATIIPIILAHPGLLWSFLAARSLS